MWRIAIALFVSVALSLPILADSDLTKIQIKVTDERGKPIERANVRVVFKQGRRKLTLTKIQHSWELKTSQEGIAKIPAIPKGDILIQVTAPYFQTYGETLEIEEDERTVEVKLNPPQPQYSAHEDNKQ